MLANHTQVKCSGGSWGSFWKCQSLGIILTRSGHSLVHCSFGSLSSHWGIEGEKGGLGRGWGQRQKQFWSILCISCEQPSMGSCIFMVCSESKHTGWAYKEKIKREEKTHVCAHWWEDLLLNIPEVTEKGIWKLPRLSCCKSCQVFAALPLRLCPRHLWQAEPPKLIVGNLAGTGGFWQVNKALVVGRPLSRVWKWDIKRRMVLDQLEAQVGAWRRAAGHPGVGDSCSQGCQQEQGGTSTLHGARAGSSRVLTRQKRKEKSTTALPKLLYLETSYESALRFM